MAGALASRVAFKAVAIIEDAVTFHWREQE
jgi:hypothetical protein